MGLLSFDPDTKLERGLKTLHGRVVEELSGLKSASPQELEYVRHSAFVSTVGASTRIENAILTDIEVNWVDTLLSDDSKTTSFEGKKALILDKLSKDKERSLEEVVGCREVMMTLLLQHEDLFPLTEAVIGAFHGDLLRHHPPGEAHRGRYKTTPNRVVSINHGTGVERTVLDPAPPGAITVSAMSDLVHWYNMTLRECTWPILAAVEFVFRFLAIHPFKDGNGRLGRALFVLALLQSGDEHLSRLVPYISIDRHIEQTRPLYYSVLHEASAGRFYQDPREYSYGPLAVYFLRVINDSLADIDIYRRRYAELKDLSESAVKVLEAFRSHPEKRLKTAEVMEVTGLPRRTAQYALMTLRDKGFLQLLGKGPGSRYQLVL